MQFDPLKDVTNKTLKTIYVERIAYDVGVLLPKHTPINVSIAEQIGINSDELVANVRMYLFGKPNVLKTSTNEPVAVLEELKVTDTWIDAIKERFFPEWLLKKFPCNYRTIRTLVKNVTNVYETRICPHLSHEGDHIHLNWINSEPGCTAPQSCHGCPACGGVLINEGPGLICGTCGYFKKHKLR